MLMKSNKVLAGCVRRRDKVVDGISNIGTIVWRPDIQAFCKKIVEWWRLNYCVGMQVIEDKNGKLYPLEINPRLQGGVSLTIQAGFNLPWLGLKVLLGNKVKYDISEWNDIEIKHWNKYLGIGSQHPLKMYRYWKEVYVE
jgi:hypothetical protein